MQCELTDAEGDAGDELNKENLSRVAITIFYLTDCLYSALSTNNNK